MHKLCNVASCWIYEYIGILLGARPILHISRIKVKIQPRILPAVRSVSEVFLNYTKQDQCVETFITSQKENDMQKFMPATVRRGYLL
jgi:hypothetical protein